MKCLARVHHALSVQDTARPARGPEKLCTSTKHPNTIRGVARAPYSPRNSSRSSLRLGQGRCQGHKAGPNGPYRVFHFAPCHRSSGSSGCPRSRRTVRRSIPSVPRPRARRLGAVIAFQVESAYRLHALGNPRAARQDQQHQEHQSLQQMHRHTTGPVAGKPPLRNQIQTVVHSPVPAADGRSPFSRATPDTRSNSFIVVHDPPRIEPWPG